MKRPAILDRLNGVQRSGDAALRWRAPGWPWRPRLSLWIDALLVLEESER